MRVMRSGDVDYIDIGVGEHFVIAVIHLADMILYFSAKATALPCVLLPTANRFLPFFSIAAAVSFAIMPVPSTARL